MAKGGVPFVGKKDQPGTGRYWEFSASTLTGLVIKAAASFGKNGQSLPSEKKFINRNETKKRVSVRNWIPWWIGGKSEDATRHLQKLAKLGHGEFVSKSYAKPEHLCYHLLQLFAPDQGDMVLSISDSYAAMGRAAIKSGRRLIHLIGPTENDKKLWEKNALPRIKAVLDREDIFGISAPKEQGGLADFECSDPGSFFIGRLSKSSVRKVGVQILVLNLIQMRIMFNSSLR